jgi:hypothetical protein
MKEPLYLIIAGLSRKTLAEQCEELMRLVAAEKLHSSRRAELQALLYDRRTREIKYSNRMRAKARAAHERASA